MRKTNTVCSFCNKELYRRPYDMKRCKFSYCSKECEGKGRKYSPNKKCQLCGALFLGTRSTNKFCGRSCSNKSRRGIFYSKKSCTNRSRKNLEVLRQATGFSVCMVHGCLYDKTFDLHRMVPGNKGGKYVLGNMFAICPNHHAEVTRKIIDLVKVNDFTLREQKVPLPPLE